MKISVVMPCFGVEKYLPAALESVLNQTYKDFEVILVDDCSVDNTGLICDEYASKYENIKTIHNDHNLGISKSRNAGFKKISDDSDYVLFMDSDDKIENTLFENVVSAIKRDNAQVVVYGLVEDFYDSNDNFIRRHEVGFDEDIILTNRESVRSEIINLEESTLYGYVWNKFYSVPYLKSTGVEFEPITLIEDIKFNIGVFQNVERVDILSIKPYYYRKRSEDAESLTSKYVPEYFEVSRARVELLYNQLLGWGVLGDNEKRILGNIYVRYIFSALQRNCDERSHMSTKDRRAWMKNLYADELFKNLISFAKTDNIILTIMIFLLRNRISFFALGVGRIIHIVKYGSPKLFSILKQNR